MIRIAFFSFCALFLASPARGAAEFGLGSLPLVDGIFQSTQTVVTGRAPVFSWEIGDAVSSFTVTVADNPSFTAPLWDYTGSTTTANTINFITRVPYNTDGSAAVLVPGALYHWRVIIYNVDSLGVVTSSAAVSRFSTVASAVTLSRSPFDLAVDWNNPFDPRSQHTVFRFAARDRDRRVQLQVFTLSGLLVRDWPEQTVLKDAWYTQTWDGRNSDGEIVARGIYLVNLRDAGEGTGVTRRVGVVKK